MPSLAKDFLDAIAEADVVLVSFAEHNGRFTVAFPRTCSTWPAASSRRSGDGRALGPHWGGDLRGTLSVPRFHDAFDVDRGALVDEALAAALGEVLGELVTVQSQRQAA